MKTLTKLFPVLLFFIVLSSCDVSEKGFSDTYFTSDTITQVVIDTNTAIQKIVIFDFTGIRCSNCPDAHETLEQLLGVHGSKIIPIAIHCTSLAIPYGSNYDLDFTTEGGDEIAEEFGITAIPTGLVNYYNKNNLIGHTAWADEIVQYIEKEAELKIDISNIYDETSKSLTSEITTTTLSDFDANLKLVVFLLESNIIENQATNEGDGIIYDYEHKHALRNILTATFGDEILSNPALTDSEEIKTFTTTLSDEWNATNCNIVAFVYNDETKQIINVEEAHLIDHNKAF